LKKDIHQQVNILNSIFVEQFTKMTGLLSLIPTPSTEISFNK